MNRQRNRKTSGFTLIELSIVMVIIGLLTVAMLNLYETYHKKEIVVSTKDNITAAREAILAFQQDKTYYPCPADPTDPMGRAVPFTGGSCSGLPSSGGVQTGVVPIFDETGEIRLISNDQSIDGWKGRLSYAVTTAMANPALNFADQASAVQVRNIKFNPVTGAEEESLEVGNFIVFSHGEDRAGAYSNKGVLIATCNAAAEDGTNCDGDAVFINRDNRSFAGGVDNNDDFVEAANQPNSQSSINCSAGQVMVGVKADGSINCSTPMSCPPGSAMTGMVGEGATLGARCQEVTLTCPADEALVAINAMTPTCVKNLPGNCTGGLIQYGTITDVPTTDPTYGQPRCLSLLMQCPADYVQVGIMGNNQPICVPNFNTTQCGNGQVQTGTNSNGTPICAAVNCPAGQYLYGVNNGAPMCSGDRDYRDMACPAGYAMQAIAGGGAACVYIPPATYGGCPAGQAVTGVYGGTVGCGAVGGENYQFVARMGTPGPCGGGAVLGFKEIKNVAYYDAYNGLSDGDVQAWAWSNPPYAGVKTFIVPMFSPYETCGSGS